MNRTIPIEVISRHEPVSERMKDYVTEKAQKLLRFHTRVSRVQVVVDGAHDAPTVEMLIHVDSGANLVAKEHNQHFRGAVDILVEKMERQLKKDNERRKHHKGGGHRKLSPDQPAAPVDEETYDEIVRRDLKA